MSTINSKTNVTDDLDRVEKANACHEKALIQMIHDKGTGWVRLAVKLEDGRVVDIQQDHNTKF